MSLAEKAAQMVGVRAFGLHFHPGSEDGRRLRHEVRDLGVGSVVVLARATPQPFPAPAAAPR